MTRSQRELNGAGISLLVPFRVNSPNDRRAITWNWLRQYWENELPEAEIVIGTHDDGVFSKTTAVNNAAKKAKGDIFVILDADCYIPGSVIVNCATQIREAKKHNERLWFMPYRRFWRLSDETSMQILNSDPKHPAPIVGAQPTVPQLDKRPDRPYHHRPPHRPHRPPHRWDTVNPDGITTSGESPLIEARGHWYGALIQIMPREAFFMSGMMDERFAGWGGEDVSFMHCVDTVYARHRTTPNGVFHLWHPLSQDTNFNRMWPDQEKAGPNGHLATRYGIASGDKDRMQKLVNEHAVEIKKAGKWEWLKRIGRNLSKSFKRACARWGFCRKVVLRIR
jgi:glycosyltransferase involved in cell wall biosynthesis